MPLFARFSVPFIPAVWIMSVMTFFVATLFVAQRSDSNPIVPLSPGTYWTYKCHDRECAGEGWSDKILMTRKETVIDSISGKGVVGALIESRELQRQLTGEKEDDNGKIVARHKSDLLSPAQYTIRLVFDNKRFYEIPADPEEKAPDKIGASIWALLKNKIATGCKIDEPNEYQLIFKLPAHLGSRWNDDTPERTDGWYCWNVENIGTVSSVAICQPALPANATFYSLAYKTCPAHEYRDFVPGVGVISFDYHHHGTLSETNEQLVDFHANGGSLLDFMQKH